MLELVANRADPTLFDELKMRYLIYVPGKYLPLLLACHMTPKEALQVINMEAVLQNKQGVLERLIDRLRIAVTRSTADPTSHLIVARTASPTLPMMENVFAERQRTMVEGDLLGWNQTNVAAVGNPVGGLPRMSNVAQMAIFTGFWFFKVHHSIYFLWHWLNAFRCNPVPKVLEFLFCKEGLFCI
jgi:hypothetical protein